MLAVVALAVFVSEHPMLFLSLKWAAIFFAFLAGQGSYILARAAKAIRNPVNPAASRMDYITRNWDILFLRMVGGQMIFWGWVTYPDLFTKFASTFGLAWNLTIPVNALIAIGFGLASDWLLDQVTAKSEALRAALPEPSDCDDKKPAEKKPGS